MQTCFTYSLRNIILSLFNLCSVFVGGKVKYPYWPLYNVLRFLNQCHALSAVLDVLQLLGAKDKFVFPNWFAVIPERCWVKVVAKKLRH